MLTEEDIIRGCKQYNKAAQMALYKKYVGKMNAVCNRYVNSSSEAKDVCQDGFIKVFSSIQQYKGEGPLGAWIRRIMVNTALNYLKNKKKQHFVSYDEATVSDEENDPELEDYSNEEGESLIHNDFTCEQLHAIINRVPDVYRLVFNLHCIENYSHKEIAQMLSIQEETSRSRLGRARKIIRTYVLEEINKRMADKRLNSIN